MMLQASGSHVINNSDNNSHSVIHSAIKYLVQNTVSLSKVCTVFLHTLQVHPVGNKRGLILTTLSYLNHRPCSNLHIKVEAEALINWN